MKLPKWFTIANISKGPDLGPESLKVELVSLTEKIVACFMIDDFYYKLTVRINGRNKVIKRQNTLGLLRYHEYMEMLDEALGDRTLFEMQQQGYEIVVHDTFLNSRVRAVILDNIKRAGKGARCIY